MASFIYDSFLADVFSGAANTSHSYKGMLVTSGYTENRATHTKRSDITNEASGTGYTAGGVALTLTASLNTATHVLTLTIPAASWPSSSGLTARKLIVYRARGGASSADELVGCFDNGTDLVSANTMTWNATTWTIPLPAPV